MFQKKCLLSVIVLCSSFSVWAQQETISLYKDRPADGQINVYPVDPLVQPSGTAVILNAVQSGNESSVNKLTETFSKKGIAVFCTADKQKLFNAQELTRTIELLKAEALRLHLNPAKIGVVNYGGMADAFASTANVAFWSMINVAGPYKLKPSASMALMLDVKNDDKSALNFYHQWQKDGGKADLYLHQQAAPDSVYAQETVNWLAGLGFLEPVSKDKTEAKKNQENWANFAKSIEDRIHNDWAWLKRYEGDNEKTPMPAPGENRVIFMGNSITEGWINQDPEFFKTNKYLNRGIGGQTTPQMLVRFREDIINLKPKVVVILAGINDIAENTGTSKIENVAGNIMSMAELARAHNIKAVLCTVLPAKAFPWHPSINPVEPIVQLNKLLKEYAQANKLSFVDYYSAMVDADKSLKKGWASDGVHPNLAGYKIMEPLVKEAINKTLSK
ncbi:SGNH/GDSL hydrolase family protein [Mucilaginibacter sp. CSA2-8R]|uniref:SGNH/GDSL hydrolase family protein n=1 Tax=Mucilaginibacter sp. CSA2-8R TaxID=3141542 RepID=UPI00315D63F3